ncbi:MAG: STAS domain-containing protein, partial [Bacteroidetes bacterium]|nr:STAS domain-containing protein [Bacteroidota bacterium]
MSVTIKNVGNTTVIGIVGKMMLGYGADDFYEAIRNAIDYDKKKIVVDLSNVQFISSWGIGILMYLFSILTTNFFFCLPVIASTELLYFSTSVIAVSAISRIVLVDFVSNVLIFFIFLSVSDKKID